MQPSVTSFITSAFCSFDNHLEQCLAYQAARCVKVVEASSPLSTPGSRRAAHNPFGTNSPLAESARMSHRSLRSGRLFHDDESADEEAGSVVESIQAAAEHDREQG